MPVIKTIVCLANSRKPSGRCIAGCALDVNPTAWIRPVSNREHGEVSENERQYQDGSDPKVLDIIRVPLISACPNGCQQENWILNPNFYWDKAGVATWVDLSKYAAHSGRLWLNGSHTYHGKNDQLLDADALSLESSLQLIHVPSVVVKVFAPQSDFGNPKRRVQAKFSFAGISYALWVTDPIIERKYLAAPDGEYLLNESYLTISISEPFNQFRYKLVAAIISR